MRKESIMSAMRYHLSSFLCETLAEIALQAPKYAPKIMKFHTRFDDAIAANGIGYIALNVENAEHLALEILKSRPDDYSTDVIGRIALKPITAEHNYAAYEATNILMDRDTRASTERLAYIATQLEVMAPLVLEILNRRKGDFVTKLIGNIGLHVDGAQRPAIDILKTRKDDTSSHEMTEIAVAYPEYAAEVFEEIKTRPGMASVFCIGQLGQEVPGMALPALAYLKDIDNSYAHYEIAEIGRKAEDATAEAIRILLDKKSYKHARSLTLIDHSSTPEEVLNRALMARDYAVASSGADPVVIDREYTAPVIRKVMPYEAYFFSGKGDLAQTHERAAKIVSAGPKFVKDDVTPGEANTMLAPRMA
jgi:hypothetical protein